jgi:hypothetical protein
LLQPGDVTSGVALEHPPEGFVELLVGFGVRLARVTEEQHAVPLRFATNPTQDLLDALEALGATGTAVANGGVDNNDIAFGKSTIALP